MTVIEKRLLNARNRVCIWRGNRAFQYSLSQGLLDLLWDELSQSGSNPANTGMGSEAMRERICAIVDAAIPKGIQR